MITEFQNDYRFLSNFWPSPIEIKRYFYPTVEHAFQAAKTLDPIEQSLIRVAQGPGHAKKLGKNVTLREDWEGIKYSAMYWIVKQKFLQNPKLLVLLKETGEQHLQEGNYWGDKYWGVCLKTDEGLNKLGRILMHVRDEL